MNGAGSGCGLPSTLTCRSSIASSSADWVFGGVRLISSASSRLVKTGPWRKVKSLVRASKTSEPVRSPGIRSGVNCTRLVSMSSAAARLRTSSVLATPGTPSSRMWPRQSRATSRPATAASWPTTALATSARTASSAERARSGLRRPSDGCRRLRGAAVRLRAGWGCSGARSWVVGPLLEVGELLGQVDQGGVVGRGRPEQDGSRPRRAGRPVAVETACTSGAGAAPRPTASRRVSRSLRCPSAARRRRGPVAGPAVEAPAALGGLDGAHHDRQRLAHEATEPAAAGEREEHDGDADAARRPGGPRRPDAASACRPRRGRGR